MKIMINAKTGRIKTETLKLVVKRKKNREFANRKVFLVIKEIRFDWQRNSKKLGFGGNNRYFQHIGASPWRIKR